MKNTNDWRSYELEDYDGAETFEKFHSGNKNPRNKDSREIKRRKEKLAKDKNQK